MTQAIAVLGMFASILAILRWFKQDTAEMIKIYSESTKAYSEATDRRIAAIEKNVEAIKEDVKIMAEENKLFHKRLLEIEASRNYEKPRCPKS